MVNHPGTNASNCFLTSTSSVTGIPIEQASTQQSIGKTTLDTIVSGASLAWNWT